MEVYTVEYYQFWDKDTEEGDFDSKTVSAEDGEEAIEKVKKLAFKSGEWIDDEETPPKKHKLSSVQIHQVLHKETLDG